jgi:hypothetical protein
MLADRLESRMGELKNEPQPFLTLGRLVQELRKIEHDDLLDGRPESCRARDDEDQIRKK